MNFILHVIKKISCIIVFAFERVHSGTLVHVIQHDNKTLSNKPPPFPLPPPQNKSIYFFFEKFMYKQTDSSVIVEGCV